MQLKFLKSLKVCHRQTLEVIRTKISDLERDIRTSLDRNTFEKTLSILNDKARNLQKKLEKKKKHKLSKLIDKKTRRRNRQPRPHLPRQPKFTAPIDPTPRTVINLSNANLSPEDINLLAKGLKYAPVPPKSNRFELKKDLEAFGRRLRLKAFFYNPDGSDTSQEDNQQLHFKEKSTWNPPKEQRSRPGNFSQSSRKRRLAYRDRKDNLNPAERRALSQLRSRTDIVIKPADKGSATVVIGRETYLTEANRQLNDQRFYRKLEKDLTETPRRGSEDSCRRNT